MQRKHKVILTISVALTLLAFVHEWIYDEPSTPYTIWQTLVEVVVIGSMYVTILFTVFLGLHSLFTWQSPFGKTKK